MYNQLLSFITQCPSYAGTCIFFNFLFNRQEDGVLGPLHVRHVKTWMNVEHLISILQNKTSQYDSDVFSHILETINQGRSPVMVHGCLGTPSNSRKTLGVKDLGPIGTPMAKMRHP